MGQNAATGLKVLGVGLGRTGTTSLSMALEILGYSVIQYDDVRLNSVILGQDPDPGFAIYDDIDAVTDAPSAYFYREILAAYPYCKAILTEREIDSWWKSWKAHHKRKHVSVTYRPTRNLTISVRRMVFGAYEPNEYIYKKRYLEHCKSVLSIESRRLLVMNIITGDGWDQLCPFLGKPIPDVSFPCERSIHHE